MENKNIGLKVLVIILGVFVLGLSGYIVYDKLLNNNDLPVEDNNGIENNNNIENNNEENISSDITEQEIKEIFEFVYNYYELPKVYCGKIESTNKMPEDGYGLPYNVSLDFRSYDEMLSHLKKFMSEEVISTKRAFTATDKSLYYEYDGKLFCIEAGKGWPYGHTGIEIEIVSQSDTKVTCIATMELTDLSNNITYDKVDITLEKSNDNWIITSYEKQN